MMIDAASHGFSCLPWRGLCVAAIALILVGDVTLHSHRMRFQREGDLSAALNAAREALGRLESTTDVTLAADIIGSALIKLDDVTRQTEPSFLQDWDNLAEAHLARALLMIRQSGLVLVRFERSAKKNEQALATRLLERALGACKAAEMASAKATAVGAMQSRFVGPSWGCKAEVGQLATAAKMQVRRNWVSETTLADAERRTRYIRDVLALMQAGSLAEATTMISQGDPVESFRNPSWELLRQLSRPQLRLETWVRDLEDEDWKARNSLLDSFGHAELALRSLVVALRGDKQGGDSSELCTASRAARQSADRAIKSLASQLYLDQATGNDWPVLRLYRSQVELLQIRIEMVTVRATARCAF